MADNKVIFEVIATAKGVKVVQKETEQLAQSTDKADRSTKKLEKSRDRYNRREKGAAQISSNSTKNFSKMQQSIDGGGGSGGLVRAYALLAANVFALTAAFGVLSRSAQVDTLTKSIEQLEVISGKSIKAVARDLQAASGFSLDFASSLRSTSLALSAGFDASQIAELGEVAKNAAVSLGRPLADALDRIFRGVIKVEPELLDEIGLFVRVDEAAQKYAATLGVAASDLTEFQKRTAFATEAITQGQQKFAAFANVDPDAFAKLGATFSDLAQVAISFVNKGLTPILDFLQNNKELLVLAFSAIAATILKSVIPAIGLFTQSARQGAQEAKSAFEDFKTEQESAAKIAKENRVSQLEATKQLAEGEVNLAKKARARLGEYKGSGKLLKEANSQLAKAVTNEEKIVALENKKNVLNRSRKESTAAIIDAQQAAIQDEIDARSKVLAIENSITTEKSKQVSLDISKGSFLDLEQARLARAEIRAIGIEQISTTASSKGFRAGLRQIGVELATLPTKAAAGAAGFGFLGRAAFVASGFVTVLSIKISELTAKLAPFLLPLSILIGFLPVISKALGLSSEASTKFGNVIGETEERVKLLSQQLSHAGNTINTYGERADNVIAAQLAFNTAIVETGEKLQEAQESLENWRKESNQFARDVDGLFGEGRLEKVIRNEVDAITTLLENFDENTSEIKLAFSAQGINEQTLKAARDAEQDVLAIQEKGREVQKQINSLKEERRNSTKEELALNNRGYWIDVELRELDKERAKLKNQELAQAKEVRDEYQSIASIIQQTGIFFSEILPLAKSQKLALDGAQLALKNSTDSARELKKSFITKTDVDKPLASIRDLNTSLTQVNEETGELLLYQDSREQILKSIADGENAILDLMTQENREAFKATESVQDRLEIIAETEETLKRQQVTLAATKIELKLIAEQQKQIKELAKSSEAAALKELDLKEKALGNDRKLLEVNATLKQQAAGITDQTARNILKVQDLSLAVEVLGKQGKDRLQVLSAILATQELINKETEIEIFNATKQERATIQVNKIFQERIKAVEKLNEAQNKGLELAAKQEAFLGRGTTELTPAKTFELSVKAEEQRLKLAEEKAKIEKAIIKAQFQILRTELEILNRKSPIAGFADSLQALSDAENILLQSIDQDFKNSAASFLTDVFSQIGGIASSSFTTGTIGNQSNFINTLGKAGALSKYLTKNITALNEEIDKLNYDQIFGGVDNTDKLIETFNKIEDLETAKGILAITLFQESLLNFANTVKSNFGPEGEVLAALANFSSSLAEFGKLDAGTFEAFKDLGKLIELVFDKGFEEAANQFGASAEKMSAAFSAIANSIGALSQLIGAVANQRVAAIDKLIEAEERADGKSSQSVAKMKEMEAKKEQIKRKAFETQKKLMIAQALMNTAAGIAAVLPLGPLALPFIAVISALGMAQVALIRKLSYQGGGGDASAPQTGLEIGKRSNAVDVSQQATGGELNYLRGGRTTGGDLGGAGGYLPGGAMGRRGYANGGEGILVGERGPEIVSPSMPVDITPNYALGGQPTNVNFNINAVDAAGVEDVLMNQRGNIIRMIREAANENGERFLETIDTQSYGSRT